jgi:hypothetical protein
MKLNMGWQKYVFKLLEKENPAGFGNLPGWFLLKVCICINQQVVWLLQCA